MSLSVPLVVRLCLLPPFLPISSWSAPTQGEDHDHESDDESEDDPDDDNESYDDKILMPGLLASSTASAAPPSSHGKSSR